MKTIKMLAAAVFAVVAGAASMSAYGAAGGDIVDIRVVDTDEMVFSGTAGNSLDPRLCTIENPLTAGDKLYIRVRMLVRNASDWISAPTGHKPDPLEWSFETTKGSAALLTPPKLGIWIGSRGDYAEYTDQGPKWWQKSGTLTYDEAGNVTDEFLYFTDFYFVYTVKAGDLGFPVLLMNSTGNGPASNTDTNHGYFIQNVTYSDTWTLTNKDSDEANFWFGSQDPTTVDWEWPPGITGDGPLPNYDLSLSEAYVKTIDFDRLNAEGTTYTDGEDWRYVYPGLSDNPSVEPKLELIKGVSENATVVYVWSADASIVEPVASSGNTIINVDDGHGGTKPVLKVTLAAGETSVRFALKGGDSAPVGSRVKIYMSPVATGVVTRPDEQLVDVTVWRWVKVVAAPAPTVRFYLNGEDVSASVTADSDWQHHKATLTFRVSPVCDSPIKLKLKAACGADDLAAMYKENYIRLCDTEGFDINGMPDTIEIDAGVSIVKKYVYILGASAATEGGIVFSAEKITAPDEVSIAGSPILNINRGGDEHPVACIAGSVSPEAGSVVTVDANGSKKFSLKIDDTYRSTYGNNTVVPTDPDTVTNYLVTVSDHDSGDRLLDSVDIGKPVAKKLEFTISNVPKLWNGRLITVDILTPDGSTHVVPISYTLKVNDSKQVVVAPTVAGEYTVGEDDTLPLTLSLNQPFYSAEAKYIFLEGDASLFTSPQTAKGAAVGPNEPFSASSSAKFLDGRAGGTPVTINGFLANNQDDPTTRDDTYAPGSVTVTVTNKPPTISMISIGGAPVMIEQGKTLRDPISSGVPKTFAVTVSDVDADLNATGDDAFWVRWSIDGELHETRGNPNGQSITHTFTSAKTGAPVYIWLKDKDMEWSSTPDFYFYIDVKAKPQVKINFTGQAELNKTFLETEVGAGAATIDLELTEPASAAITVRFTVSKAADGGYLKLRTTPGSIEQAVDGGGEPIEGAYDVYFPERVTHKELYVAEMDGTDGSADGLSLSAKVTTETENPDHVKWCDFYTEANDYVFVQNVPPVIRRPTEAEESRTNMNASANTPYTVYYRCTDVTADLAAGITVEISVDGSLKETVTVTDTDMHSCEVEFAGDDLHIVEIVFTDKDNMPSSSTLYYMVNPVKTLELRAHGPAGPVGTSGGYSQRYGLASGLGAGRVYAGENGPQKIRGFVHTYAVTLREQSVTAQAFGYKADGNVDDGSLTPTCTGYFGIDKDGNWSKTSTIADYYNYSAQNRWGKLGFDSFMYAWACNNTESTSSSGGDSDVTTALIFNMGERGSTQIPMPDDTGSASSSGSSGNSSKTYPKQYWEAIFSRELFKADNCGDINQDGVPDEVVYRYGFGIFENGKLAESGGDSGAAEGDLTDFRDWNGDKNKDGEDWPDFLPSQETSPYGSLIPGLNGTWVTAGVEFGARLEIRGYHDGLNDALVQLGFDIESDRVYAEEVDGVWKWTENCTISETEWYAWTEYAAAKGLDWKDSAAWAQWSPERPTSPSKSDTDGDGFDDGYEYFFWYRAHVGWLETGAKGVKVHKRLTGRRYDPRNPGCGTLITSDEIETLMDPQVATSVAGARTRDTDNDGLPDLLEFMIGTNPFDFDTDGDHLPDGWELMIAGLNPLLAGTSADAKNDAERNYDGDAMAITSYRIEAAEQTPPNPHPENVQYTTFAVIDPDGDTDGVQWYATKAEVAFETNTVSAWSFTLADGTDCVATEKPLLTDDGRLAKGLDSGVAYTATVEIEYVPDEADPSVTNEVKTVIRGWPVRLEPGTRVDPASVADDAADVVSLKVAKAIKAKDAHAAWVYGRGTNDTSFGEVAATANDYGCLALGRQLAVVKGAEICAAPSDQRDVALLHYLVYQEFGFDPRTAWRSKSPLAARWGKSANGEGVEGVYIVGRGGYCSYPARTRDYATYDEFLVYSFFLNNGCDMSGYTHVISDKAPLLAQTWGAFTTNPQGPDEPDRIELEPQSEALSAVGWTQYFFGRDDLDNGADTDGDGVPDGWELYVMAGPKMADGSFVFAPPYAGFITALSPLEQYRMPTSAFSPFVDSAKKNDTNNQIYLGGSANDDTLNEYQEFEGTDSINHYAVPETENASPFSTTVVHDGDWKWLNKFFPSDPWNVDTDGDGVKDNEEGSNFVYGTPADDGKLRSIPGGGLNPNSVDTDCDGLPDEWEKQFAGSTPFPGDLAQSLAEKGQKAKDADGNEIGNYLQGLVDGMDGTVRDAFSYPIEYDMMTTSGTNVTMFVTVDGVSQVVNRDYDHDGLENWQEYLTGTMRCWRYDDPFSPWMSIPAEAYWTWNEPAKEWTWDPKFDRLGVADEDEFWYRTLVDKSSPIYNPRLVTDTASGSQYFSRLVNVWDAAYLDSGLNEPGGAYYWFRKRIGDTDIKSFWTKMLGEAGYIKEGWFAEPQRYACCSPLDPDSDHDGMDDYYELFHGMNPLLGKSGVGAGGEHTDEEGPFDIVYDSWAWSETRGERKPALEAWGSGDTMNYWQHNPWKAPRGNGYDFEVFPWLNGVVDADPDGDIVPNQTESMLPEMNVAAFHTDPTPLWMTDSTYTNSLVHRFFRLPARFENVIPAGDTFTYGDKVYEFKDFDTWVPATMVKPAHFDTFKPDPWNLLLEGSANWIFSFEENEGFDSDHDGISDYEEKEGKFHNASDPQHADSPRRRQAMYFSGPKRPSALQTMPEIAENYPTFAGYPDDPSFLQYTVECWVRPTALTDAVIVERAVWSSVEHPDDSEYMRKNFQIAIKDGYWYTKFDPVGTAAGGPVEAVSKTPASKKKWTHLAATYDGETLVFYVDGVAERTVKSGLPPCYGSEALAVTAFQKYWFDIEYKLTAVIVGASAKTQAEGAPDGGALDLTRGLGWDRYTKFFTGWVDEIRIWDGARTSAEIREAMTVRMDSERATANRSTFYEAWADGRRRYDKNDGVADASVPAELRYHWSFDSIFGADNEGAAATAPHGFGGERALMSRPDGYEIPWWKTVLEGDGTAPGYANTVYADTDWICWIPNTVAHLPRFDGTTLDSVYWSDDYRGDVSGTYGFARTAEPVSIWKQMTSGGVDDKLQYRTTGSRHLLVNTISSISNGRQSRLFSFAGRHLNQSGDDLVALGGAFAKYCDDGVDMWDEQGPSTNWEITGTDTDGDGLPDWWETYADKNYRPQGYSGDIGWTTIIDWNGLSITAGEAYLRDLARGSYMDENGKAVVGTTKYEQRADEDANGIPDWWAELYGISGESGLDDHDHDGLSNYVEYLLSEVFSFDNLVFDPTDPCSVDQYTPDYFYRVGSLYVGEIFTDHDLVEDEWEDKYPTTDDGSAAYASRLAYDAFADADEDGWSNRSEARYSSMVMPIVANSRTHYAVTDGLVADYPVPTIALKLRYNGGRQSTVAQSPIVVQMTRASNGVRTPDAEFSISAATEKSGGTGQDSTKTDSGSTSYTRTIGKWADRHMLGTLTPGNVALNSLAFEFCNDPSSVVYTWEVKYTNIYGVEWWETRRGSRSSYDYDKRKYGDTNVKLVSADDNYVTLEGLELRTDETGDVATWVHNTTGIELGTVNLNSGAFDVNLGALKGQYVANPSNKAEYASLEDQTYRIRYASHPSDGLLPRDLFLGAADSGYVREGLNDIVAFADLNGNGKYDSGEPYGIVQGVNVSWKGTSAEIELTDASPVVPRFDVWSAGVTLQYNTTNAVDASSGSSDSGVSLSSTEPVRVRVVRWKIDDAPNYAVGVNPRVVFDKMMDPRVATTLTEEDFLGENVHDIDWDYFSSEVTNGRGVIYGNFRVVKADYLVVVGDGPVSWLSPDDTNTVVTASKQVITRRFDEVRVLPTPVAPASVSPVSSAMGVVNSANPTFAWKIDGDTYTAFRIIVTNTLGTVYDSGVRRAPARDDSGVYRWTAPLYVGDMTPLSAMFANKSVYGWRVAMYNAKFRSDAWSTEPATFYLNVQTNGYDYGTASVAVRYFGPVDAYGAKAVRIRVQAFTSPDFTGIPVAAGYVMTKSTVRASGSAPKANCTVVGLPAGKYYLRAFVDSDGDGVCDDWESSGYLCARDGTDPDILVPTPITIGPDVGKSDLAVIYIEDADTDGDGLPDSWEYAKYGSLEAKGIELLSETPAGEQLVNRNLTGALSLRSGAKVPTAGLSAKLGSSLNNAGLLALALGVPTDGYDSFTDAISGSVSEKLAENGVKIASLSFVGGKVYISVEVATETGKAAESPLVADVPTYGIPVRATVLWKQSLSDLEWHEIGGKSFITGSGVEEISVGAATEGTSGFFKVVVEED